MKTKISRSHSSNIKKRDSNANARYRPAIFVVIYKLDRETNKPIYLLLKREKHWKGWEFTKGGIEKGETEKQTLLREVKEECGLKILKIGKYKEKGKYKYPADFKGRPSFIGQTYSLYSVQIKEGKVKIDKREHSDFKWLDFTGARKIITYNNQKKCLSIVNSSLL
jgi:8-oxo-dGTP pyrophosphatase MutT (NUDIX family)